MPNEYNGDLGEIQPIIVKLYFQGKLLKTAFEKDQVESLIKKTLNQKYGKIDNFDKLVKEVTEAVIIAWNTRSDNGKFTNSLILLIREDKSGVNLNNSSPIYWSI